MMSRLSRADVCAGTRFHGSTARSLPSGLCLQKISPSHIPSLSGVARRDRIPGLHKPKLHRLVGWWVRALLQGDQTRCPLDCKSILDMQNEGVCPLMSCSLAKNSDTKFRHHFCSQSHVHRGSKLTFFLWFFGGNYFTVGWTLRPIKSTKHRLTQKKQAEIYILLLMIPQLKIWFRLTHHSGSLLAAGHTISHLTSNTLAHPRSLY